MQLDELDDELRKALFDEHPSPMAVVAPDHRYMRCNDAYCRLLGYSRSELLQRGWPSVTHPDDLDGDLAGAEALKHDPHQRRYTVEKRYLGKFNNVVRVRIHVQAVWLDGKFVGFIVVAEPLDLTNQPATVAKSKRFLDWCRDNPREAIVLGIATGTVVGRDFLLEIVKTFVSK